MTEEITKMLFSGLIGMITAGIPAYIAGRNNYKIELLKIEGKNSEKLYDKRIIPYEELMKELDRIYAVRKKFKKPNEMIERNRECLNNIRVWKREHNYLLDKNTSLKKFYKLEEALAANPGNGDAYHPSQLEKIEKARVDFVNSLNADLNILHKLTENMQKKLD